MVGSCLAADLIIRATAFPKSGPPHGRHDRQSTQEAIDSNNLIFGRRVKEATQEHPHRVQRNKEVWRITTKPTPINCKKKDFF